MSATSLVAYSNSIQGAKISPFVQKIKFFKHFYEKEGKKFGAYAFFDYLCTCIFYLRALSDYG